MQKIRDQLLNMKYKELGNHIDNPILDDINFWEKIIDLWISKHENDKEHKLCKLFRKSCKKGYQITCFLPV